ncbi:MAG: N-acetylneuraminate synthase family protein, partial [Phycisphaeraceae bacterium]|nr:N-acetylneuraminate synthase family protein [Phycisphaeraceae bacterium]
MRTLCVIIARAGSKGLPGKNTLDVCGAPMIAHTIEHALMSMRLDRIVVSTDGEQIAEAAREVGVEVIDRPEELAGDTATVDAAVRHAVEQIEANDPEPYDAVVILYGNVPLRPDTLTDRAVQKLMETGCDSVQSVSPVGKHHPMWMVKLGGAEGDLMVPYQQNNFYRRQDLPPVYALDGGVIAVKRDVLFETSYSDPHAFLGTDRRAVITSPNGVVDVDTPDDLLIARALFGAHHADGSKHVPGLVTKDAPLPSIEIRGRHIQDHTATYVIAELGVNHDGNLQRALDLTRAAHAAGADAVKMQLYDPALLLSAEAELAEYQRQCAENPHEMLERLQLSVEDKLQVRDLAHELGLGFIVTCYSIELFEQLARLDPDAVKIASPDCVNLPLIETMLQLGKPMLVSVGTAEQEDMPELDAMAKMCTASGDLAILQAVSSYPVPEGDSGIGWIRWLRDWFGVPVGYSDHTNELHTGMLAVTAGACIVEKHLTHDPTAPGPDHAVSFDPVRFRGYVELIRIAERELYGQTAQHEDIEDDVRRVSRQSVCARNDLKSGQILQRDDVTIKRPGTGIPAAMLNNVVGATLTRDIPA